MKDLEKLAINRIKELSKEAYDNTIKVGLNHEERAEYHSFMEIMQPTYSKLQEIAQWIEAMQK